MKLAIQSRDARLAQSLAAACERNGHESRRVATLAALEQAVQEWDLDLAVVDLAGGAQLDALRESVPALRVLALISDSSPHSVVEALRAGADEALLKPFGVDELEASLRRAAGPLRTAFDWVAAAASSRALLEHAQRAAVAGASVLIRGELGVGKTHLARLVHDLSPRRAGPRVEVNLTDLEAEDAVASLLGSVASDGSRRAGWIEAADGGTLVLEGLEALREDPVARSHAAVEDLLLEFIDRREVRPLRAASSVAVDVRIVATLRTPARGARKPTPPSALETRLGVAQLDLMPLSMRRDDIAPLANHFLAHFASATRADWPQLEAQTIAELASRAFPGNVTELRNLMERAVLLFPGARVELAGLTGDAIAAPAPRAASGDALEALNLREMERAAVIRSLELSRGNRSVAARALGVSTRTLRNKIQSYGLR